MKKVAIYIVWILGCTFVTICIGEVVVGISASLILNPSPATMLAIFGTGFLILLAGPVVGILFARQSTRKRRNRLIDSDDPYSDDNKMQ
jgi:hypothetical protein